jgi:Tfp pilus assembly protein PilF
MELKEYDVADAELKKALILAGNDDGMKIQVLSMIGDLRFRMKDPEAAYSYYEEALKLSPGEVLVLNNYAYFLAEEGQDLKKALRMAEEVMRREGNNPTYIDTYAWVLYKLGKQRKAWKQMQRIIDAGEANDPEILEHIGYILFKLGRCDEAVEYWKGSLEKDSTKTYLEEEIRRCGR